MSRPVWILGGTIAEARDYMREQGTGPREAHIIGSAEGIRGSVIHPSQVVRVGTWASRRDLARVEENLRIAGLFAMEEGR